MTSSPTLIRARVILLVSAALLAVAPAFMPESYSWIAHTTSESAGQGVGLGWIARVGFLAMSIGVTSTTMAAHGRWNPLTTISHAAFAVCMLGAAVFSSKPWVATPYNSTEDSLHSFFAGAMGFAFVLGVVSSHFDREGKRRPVRLVDAAAVIASIVIPLAMFNVSGVAGILQRGMFAVAFWWYLTVDRERRFTLPRDPP